MYFNFCDIRMTRSEIHAHAKGNLDPLSRVHAIVIP